MSCPRKNDLDLFGIDVHFLGYECDNQWGPFLGICFATVAIKLMQNKLYAAQAQKQRELLQLEKCERTKGCWDSKLAWVLVLEFCSTFVGILSVLVIMGANAIIFFLIIFANLLGTAITYMHMEKDHHSTAKDIINMCELLEKPIGKCDGNMKEKIQKAKNAIEKLKTQLNITERVDLPGVPIIKDNNEMNHRLAFSF